MSTQVNTYVMYGVILSYRELKAKHGSDLYDLIEPYTDSAFKRAFNPKDGITVLFDGMNGKYVAIGHVIAKTDNWQGFEEAITIPPEDTVYPHLLVVDALIERLGLVPTEVSKGGQWHVISHYR